MKEIFNLEKVDVEFDKHSLDRKTLREVIGAKLNGQENEKICALQDISLRIFEGEHIGIIGRNGAGKSTLLKVFTGVISPTWGRVIRATNKHIVPLLELGIGFQPDLSGRENCMLAGILMGYSPKEIRERIEDIIKFAELENFIDEPVKNYSSGMYARLAFAIATDVKPEVLLIDEVFGVGDEFFMRKCIARMQRLMKNGSTTIFVSHNIDFLVSQCSRLVWIDKGKIIMDGNPNFVSTIYRKQQGMSLEIKVQCETKKKVMVS
ncbi:MAG: ABC transporter ATP-binding protein [Ignavibacteriales bacterium]|nr:ABC transporter ATP-binding protein [Ignavibacteriales bacterium]